MFTMDFGSRPLDDLLDDVGLKHAFDKNLEKASAYARALAMDALPPFARRTGEDQDHAAIEALAHEIQRGFKELVVLGTGGSSLGAQAALAIARYRPSTGVTVHTPDSLCPFEMDRLFATLDPNETHVLSISKSGTTAETLAQLLAFRAWLEPQTKRPLKDHFSFITEPKPSALRAYGEALGSHIVEHPLDVGGRFSVLTTVGMVPVAAAGLSVKGFRHGAHEIYKAVGSVPETTAAVIGAALTHTLAEHRGVTQVLLMAYADALRAFTRWHGQLWAESLGKDGKGTTPIRAVGPVDQHSQLQLFLDGPDDKFSTFIVVPSYGKGPRLDPKAAKDNGLDYMAGRTIGDTVTCQARATQDALRARGRIIRQLTINALDEENIGALFMSFMLETVVMAHLMGVDAFDQPAVEESKILTRKYLAELE
ncbi:hypothetical protein [Gimibacter soli]|uniref:Glucose-6-phosphate isomerase n=1 Tax=Gimibacter soli TaxID=3024400 RepID=A0AAE9XRQ2_9PROT|nr:hypothetical protein [Gimibacter soli]WCL55136.1 hypothetical protein PH603_05110 [Gimibacter soli]